MQIGRELVCIDDAGQGEHIGDHVVDGKIYTVENVLQDDAGVVGLQLVGMKMSPPYIGYNINRFAYLDDYLDASKLVNEMLKELELECLK